jgi:HKD family nuclease
MAKFLNAAGAQSALVDLIKNAEKKLIIVSPYVKLSSLMKGYITGIDKKGISLIIVYRSDTKLTEEDLAFFKGLSHLKLYHCDNLHTKCYINERAGLVTSMNLHEHSQSHNWEMGILFSKESDATIFADVSDELRLMGTQIKPIELHPAKKPAAAEKSAATTTVTQKPAAPRLAKKPTEAPNKGLIDIIIDTVIGKEAYCIRCGKMIDKFDMQKPYCEKCYASWARYRNPKYKEKHCHACGRIDPKHLTSFEKPVCKECFTKLFK